MNSSKDIIEEGSAADGVVFFWKIDQAFGEFSQWYRSGFECDEHQFSTAEQYMMYRKAIIFNDIKSAERILTTPRAPPAEHKRMGRKVSNFDLDTWNRYSRHVVVNGNFHKFVSNSKLMQMLLGTGNKLIVEASPLDNIWGIGFDAKNAMMHVDDWGENRLGKCLMVVRGMIRDILSQISGDISPKLVIDTAMTLVCYFCMSVACIKPTHTDGNNRPIRVMVTTCGSCMEKQGPAFGLLDESTAQAIAHRTEIMNLDRLRIMHPFILTFLDMEKYTLERLQGVDQDSNGQSWIPVIKCSRSCFRGTP